MTVRDALIHPEGKIVATVAFQEYDNSGAVRIWRESEDGPIQCDEYEVVELPTYENLDLLHTSARFARTLIERLGLSGKKSKRLPELREVLKRSTGPQLVYAAGADPDWMAPFFDQLQARKAVDRARRPLPPGISHVHDEFLREPKANEVLWKTRLKQAGNDSQKREQVISEHDAMLFDLCLTIVANGERWAEDALAQIDALGDESRSDYSGLVVVHAQKKSITRRTASQENQTRLKLLAGEKFIQLLAREAGDTGWSVESALVAKPELLAHEFTLEYFKAKSRLAKLRVYELSIHDPNELERAKMGLLRAIDQWNLNSWLEASTHSIVKNWPGFLDDFVRESIAMSSGSWRPQHALEQDILDSLPNPQHAAPPNVNVGANIGLLDQATTEQDNAESAAEDQEQTLRKLFRLARLSDDGAKLSRFTWAGGKPLMGKPTRQRPSERTRFGEHSTS